MRSVMAAVVGSMGRAACAMLAFCVLFANSALAQSQTEQAKEFARVLVEELTANANDPALDEAQKSDQYRIILRDKLAADPIGRFLFNGSPNALATEMQRQQYTELFPDYIAASFADQIGALAEREIIILGAVSRGDQEAIVQSRLLDASGREKAVIDWRLRWYDGEPQLLDVLVERVSPLVTKRQEFSSLASRQGVDALLAHMRDVVNTQAEAS